MTSIKDIDLDWYKDKTINTSYINEISNAFFGPNKVRTKKSKLEESS